MTIKNLKYLLSALLSLPLLFSLKNQPIELLNIPHTLDTYMDSSCEVSVKQLKNGALGLAFRIDEHANEKYAGVTLDFETDKNGFDFTRYNRLICRYDSVNTDGINLIFETFVPGFTTPEKRLSYRYLEQNFKIDQNAHEIKLRLNKFNTPAWWYEHHNSSPESFGKSSLKTVKGIKIENSEFSYSNKPQYIMITSLQLKQDRTVLLAATIALTLLYLFGMYLFSRKQSILIPYEKIVQERENNSDLEKILQHISTDYPFTSLSLSDISIKSGITASTISEILKVNLNCTFRQYLNMLRMTEAQRLLKESNLRISEIAFKVGYSNTTHFNRIFKEFAKITPTKYREKNN